MRDLINSTTEEMHEQRISNFDLLTLGNQWEIKVELRIIPHVWIIVSFTKGIQENYVWEEAMKSVDVQSLKCL